MVELIEETAANSRQPLPFPILDLLMIVRPAHDACRGHSATDRLALVTSGGSAVVRPGPIWRYPRYTHLA